MVLKGGLLLGGRRISNVLDCFQYSCQTLYPFFYRRILIGPIFNLYSWTPIGLSSLWLVYSFISAILYCGTDFYADFEGG